MKKIFVTGADGFIGSHLVEKLVLKGHKVKALSIYNSFNNWGWLEDLPNHILKEIEIVSGDIRDEDLIKKLTKDVDKIFHFLHFLLRACFLQICQEAWKHHTFQCFDWQKIKDFVHAPTIPLHSRFST